jgi:translation elongation factor EF-Tu-like GTPase
MINNRIVIKAKITFKSTEEGGRKTGIKSGYRPNHAFEKPVNIKLLRAYIGEIIFDYKEFIQPGETNDVTVSFLKVPEIEKFMKVGQKWFIYEPPILIAEGELIEI